MQLGRQVFLSENSNTQRIHSNETYGIAFIEAGSRMKDHLKL